MKMNKVMLMVIALGFSLPFTYGGCGGGDGDGGGGSGSTLNGTWVTYCRQISGGSTWEQIVFNAQTGEVREAEVGFLSNDCSGDAVAEEKVRTGSYETGNQVECFDGSNGNCTELDLIWDNGAVQYLLYSIDTDYDPDELCLGSSSDDPADRDKEVDNCIYNIPFPENTGEAIIGLTVIDGGGPLTGGTPPPAPAGYTLLPYDLNEGSGGNYVWLYYQMGRADGLQGTPIGKIYTVAEFDGETALSGYDTRLSVSLNSGSPVVDHNLWLYHTASSGPVIRCVVVANESDGVTVYGPPEAEGKYSVVWVEELSQDYQGTPSNFPQPSNAQDLNEGEGPWTDWIFLGYCVD